MATKNAASQDPSNDERYSEYHSGGRWQGLPLRAKDEDVPRFERLTAPGQVPAVLMFGAPNHGMMSGQPTNVFIVGDVDNADARLTLVDTGDATSLDAVLAALDESGINLRRFVRIVLTHCHPDHIGNANELKSRSGAEVWADRLESEQIARWGNGIDIDHWIKDGVDIECEGYTLRPIFTPGHSPGHHCIVETNSNILIAGDMISGFGSVGIFPPNGSMAQYMDSLRKLLAVNEATPFALVGPGHGPAISDAKAKIEEYIVHRLAREEEVYQAVVDGYETVDTILAIAYPDVKPHLSFAATCTLQAHLDKLVDDGRIVTSEGTYRVA